MQLHQNEIIEVQNNICIQLVIHNLMHFEIMNHQEL